MKKTLLEKVTRIVAELCIESNYGIREAGPNSGPPIVVGIGGIMATSTFLAKKALLRPIKARNPEVKYALLEEELLREINELEIGAQGLE